MILRDRCSTSYDLASIFTLDRWSGKIAKRIGTRLSALHSTFHFEGSLAELLGFWCCQVQKLKKSRSGCCQVQKMKKSRRLVSFLTLFSSKIEEVSQNSFLFMLADRQIDRQPDRQRDREIER